MAGGVGFFRLTKFIGKTRQAAEPVFSVADELVLRNFCSILRTSLDDPALLNAIMLTFSFAVAGVINIECLGYQQQAFSSIRLRMNCPDEAASESTLAAILLLVGVEVSTPFRWDPQLPSPVHLHRMIGVERYEANVKSRLDSLCLAKFSFT